MKSKRGRPFGTHEGKHPTTFNGKPTRMYRKWQSMHARCYGLHPSTKHYQSRGITICDRWKGHGGFDAFFDDMGECPPGLTLERKDNAKGYEPGNCCWATWKEQAANREGSGAKLDPDSLKGNARAAGLPYMVVYLRVKRLGWSESDALNTPKSSRLPAEG